MKTAGLKPNVVTFYSLLNGYCKHNRLEKIETLLDEMKENGLNPDDATYLNDRYFDLGFLDKTLAV